MTDLRSAPRNPFGPRQPGMWGGLLRAAQWGLTVLTVICMWPAVMLFFTALTDFLPLLRGGSLPHASTLRIHGAWCLWTALLILTGLRISGQWFRWWAFLPVAAAYGVLAAKVMPDAADPVGRCIWLLMLIVAVVQVLLHAVWSLSAWLLRRKGD